jgi:ABC-type Mn2+/Zn2+ transport system ATPase subunit
VAAHLPRIICLNRAVIADGSPIDVLNANVVRATYGAEMDVVLYNGRPVVVDTVSPGRAS